MTSRVQHVVLFRFPTELTEDEVAEMRARIRSWPERIGGFTGLRFGPDPTGERTQGFQYLLFEEFESREALDAYQPHPVHREFTTWVADRHAETLAFDYALDADTVVVPAGFDSRSQLD
jgi:hypothetical protein